ncbi:MAG: DUF3619 family protein [Burkholderiales bacterium]|nr:DUF3619 family protein [Burkholderiales bacterium]
MKTHNDTQQDQLGRKIAIRLHDGAETLPHDITERLKVARLQALARRKVSKPKLVAGISSQGNALALHLNGDNRSLWNRVASLLPLLALIVGLLIIDAAQEQWGAQELADIDTELLTDDLPPSAYTDPGFVHFLSTKQRN